MAPFILIGVLGTGVDLDEFGLAVDLSPLLVAHDGDKASPNAFHLDAKRS